MYEIHVTADPSTDPEWFRSVCVEVGVKPLVITNIHRNGDLTTDLVTSSTALLSATLWPERKLADRLSEFFPVIRCKSETNPRHTKHWTYLEAHILVDEQKNIPWVWYSRVGGKLYATFRNHYWGLSEFEKQLEIVCQLLRVPAPQVEAAVYDSNEAHDFEWMKSG